MKLTSAICVIILAATSSAVAVANPEAEAHPFCQGGRRIGCPFNKREAAPVAEPFCQGGRRIGCPFNKRAAEAFAFALAAPVAEPFCQGGRRIGCPFNKRAADAEAFCHTAEGACTKAKRHAEALAEAVAHPDAILAVRSAFPDPEAEPEPFCQGGRRIGCPFNKKRDLEADVAVTDDVKRDAEAFCHAGGPCAKAKRAAEAIAEAMAEPSPEADPFCQGGRRIGCPFNKRDSEIEDATTHPEAKALADRAANVLASL